jgi:predicted metal-dependent phosphotriesterase family hydrolase
MHFYTVVKNMDPQMGYVYNQSNNISQENPTMKTMLNTVVRSMQTGHKWVGMTTSVQIGRRITFVRKQVGKITIIVLFNF